MGSAAATCIERERVRIRRSRVRSSRRATSISESSATFDHSAAIRVGQPDFELGANRRQRAAQLVRCSRGEQLLTVGRLFEPIQHAIQRQTELGDLVVARTGVERARQVGRLDAIDLGAHRVDRRQRTGDALGRSTTLPR